MTCSVESSRQPRQNNLVSYVAVIDVDRRSVLLVEHRDAGLLLPAGGHVESGEDPGETARREAREELGIEAQFLPEVGPRPLMVTQTTTKGAFASHTDVSLWYVVEHNAESGFQLDKSEFVGAGWWTWDQINDGDPARFDPHIRRSAAKLARPGPLTARKRGRGAGGLSSVRVSCNCS